jgi:Ca-activated chloride channel family protein
LGALQTPVGNLPLVRLEVEADIVGIFAQTVVRQTFKNPTNQPLEAVYIFPLPERAGVSAFTMRVGDRLVEAVLEEREQARQEYEQAIQQGYRASMLEEERPNVFTLSVGNLMPGEEAEITLTLNSVLPLDAGEATYLFPLVVAPRYIPGVPLDDDSVGYGTVPDTDAVPDASRITPPVLLPGFPNPVQLSITVRIDGRTTPIHNLRASLHNVTTTDQNGVYTICLQPNERLDRDFILRYSLLQSETDAHALLSPDPDNPNAGTLLTLIHAPAQQERIPLSEVVFVLDRSGSMEGWKMDAAKRAVACLLDSLSPNTHFALLAFDNTVETFNNSNWMPANNRSTFQASQWLAHLWARGGTEMAQALSHAFRTLQSAPHHKQRGEQPLTKPAIVLITDGQVGNDEQILRLIANANITIYAIGIDEALNDALLHRIAEQTGGAFMPIESEDRLDETLALLQERLSAPLLTDIQISSPDIPLVADTATPKQPVNLYAQGVAYMLQRWQGNCNQPATVQVQAKRPDGSLWSVHAPVEVVQTPVLRVSWARHMVRTLEDQYYLNPVKQIEQEIVDISLRYGVLSRFTAYVAIDRSATVNEGGKVHRIVQPVEPAHGWKMLLAVADPCLLLPDLDQPVFCLHLPEQRGEKSRYRFFRKRDVDTSARHRTVPNPWRERLTQLERISLNDPTEVDRFLLELVQALDEWSAEHPDAPQQAQVVALMDAILVHFNLPWDAERVAQLIAQCRETLALLSEVDEPTTPTRRRRWW